MATEPLDKLPRGEAETQGVSVGRSAPAGKTAGASAGAAGGVPLPGDIEEIRVRGARVHNLKNIDFVIPSQRYHRRYGEGVSRLRRPALGVRYAIRRGAASLYRIAFGLRAAIFGAD